MFSTLSKVRSDQPSENNQKSTPGMTLQHAAQRLQASRQLTRWSGTSLALLGTLRYIFRYRDSPWFPSDRASSAGLNPALLGVSRLAPAFMRKEIFFNMKRGRETTKKYREANTVGSVPAVRIHDIYVRMTIGLYQVFIRLFSTIFLRI